MAKPTPVTINGIQVGAITRTPYRTWLPFILTADGQGYLPIGYGQQDVPTPTEARDMVIAEHNLLVRMGDRQPTPH